MMKQHDDAPSGISRRNALALGASVGAGFFSLLHGRIARAQSSAGPVETPPGDPKFPRPAVWKTEFRKLAPHVYGYVQAGGPGVGSGGGISNAGIIESDDRLMVIDTLGQPMHTKALIAAVRANVGNKPFDRVINTHQHGDHVAGNQFFLPAEIVGHPWCRKMVLEMDAAIPPGAKYAKREGASDGTEPRKLHPPTTTVTDKMTYYYGGTEVQLLHLGVGHTWGDLVVYLPEHKILFVGDVAVYSMAPWSHQGHIGQWMDVIDRIMAMDVDVIVPGHGPFGSKKELAELREYFVLLRREARKRFDTGMTPGKAAAEINFGKFANWVGAERNLLNTFRLYCEFDGSITPMLDLERMKKATDEYNAIIKAAKGSAP